MLTRTRARPTICLPHTGGGTRFGGAGGFACESGKAAISAGFYPLLTILTARDVSAERVQGDPCGPGGPGVSVFLGRLIGVIDDQDVDRVFARFDLEAHLFLKRRHHRARRVHPVRLIRCR
jgi:hypothetical protein